MHSQQFIVIAVRGKGRHRGKEEVVDTLITVDDVLVFATATAIYCTFAIPRDTFATKVVTQGNVFTVNVFAEAKKPTISGKEDGEWCDLFDRFGLEREESEAIDCPRIKGVADWAECEVQSMIPIDQHCILIGKVAKKSTTFK
ncbi:flavin reductase family protein [Candidatus Woesearchaeota archaeon]|nr:flavin reductase family protein [Candidatus Woesearchaeota archaeon]